MADKEKKTIDKAAEKEAKLAAKAALKAKKERIKKNKSNKEKLTFKGFFVRIFKAIAKFIKDFRGTAKKVVWPDLRTVVKNTGIVLLVVGFLGAVVWAIDFTISEGKSGFESIIVDFRDGGEDETTTSLLDGIDAGDEDDHDHEEGEEPADETTIPGESDE